MYLDSCILVKLVSHEPDSAAYDQLLRGQAILTSELTVAEVRSALLAKERAGRISRAARLFGWALFQERVREGEFELLPLTRAVIERAGGVIEQCHPGVPLRILDALHVASMELLGNEVMCSSDLRVRAACDHPGLALAPLPATSS
jgi:predicted nucleic acid-binding protein